MTASCEGRRGGGLTAARWLLAQLQPVDGQPVGSSAQVALLSFALHVAFALRGVGRLDLVAAVALRSELQTGVHVTPWGRRERKRKTGQKHSWRFIMCLNPSRISIQSSWMWREDVKMFGADEALRHTGLHHTRSPLCLLFFLCLVEHLTPRRPFPMQLDAQHAPHTGQIPWAVSQTSTSMCCSVLVTPHLLVCFY